MYNQFILHRIMYSGQHMAAFILGVDSVCEAMAFRKKSLMDIDIDSSACNLLPLKRYNSAPYINSISEIKASSDSVTQTVNTVVR